MSTLSTIHPRLALFGAEQRSPNLPVCDHYAGIEARMRKSLALQADMASQTEGRAVFDVTLDLEDGAPVGGEHEQALLVAELLNSAANACGRVGARVHAPSHPRFEDDIHTLIQQAGPRLAYLMVPKVAGEEEAKRAVEAIKAARLKHGVGHIVPVHVLIETHQALQEVAAIAALPGVESLSFGLMDFVSEHRGAIPASAMSAQGQFHHPLVLRAKLEIAAACHAARITPSHCVVTEFRDARALGVAAERASRELGYTRMWSIHPDQIPVIVDAFAPVAAEVDDAVAILSAAQQAHWAPTSYRSVLQDRASYRHYWHVLERAWLTGQPLPAEIEAAFFG
ncbi:aldolase/citrate lyase family protein [Aquabacterium sp.]|uniref:HpcH/HpaI aldolase/citrate lyase family protein n=1 Tax=Aquabacterium sp. TaxID=1872578 RepID=UPI00248862E4|nr:aldolase/citrate lyase family protein [Aquabacterium sp.]MDI1260189.1 aldolase/citrate lyase family protein [Aquabacterium sp.]